MQEWKHAREQRMQHLERQAAPATAVSLNPPRHSLPPSMAVRIEQ